MLSPPKTPAIERCRLRVVVEPPAGTGALAKDSVVQVRSMHGSHGSPSNKAWQPLKPDGTGAFEGKLSPGRYLIGFSAPDLRPEHRPIELQGIGVEVTLSALPWAQRRVRIGGQRRASRTPVDEITAFLEPGATGMAIARVFAAADRLGLNFDPTRAEDPGVFKVAALMGLRDERPVAERPDVAWVDVRQADPRGIPEPIELPPADDDLDPADLDALLPPEQSAALKTLRPEVRDGRPSLAVPLRAAPNLVPSVHAIATLRRLPSVLAAGANLSADPRLPMVRHPAIDARLLPGAKPAEVFAALRAPWARLLRFASLRRPGPHPIAGLYRVIVPSHFDETIEDIIDGLLATGLVLYAEPCLAERGELLAGEPDLLASRQWDLGLIAVDPAHQRLRDVPATTTGRATVTVIDEGITHIHHAVLHADLAGQVRLFDVTGLPGGHAMVQHNHGGKVAGLIAAIDHPGRGEGLRGVSPKAAINALSFNPATFTGAAEAFRAAGGLTATTQISGTDVIVFAMRIVATPATPSQPPTASGLPSTAWGVIPDAFRTLATRGRNGRGCLIVLSAGNSEDAIATHNPIACSTDIIACGASDWTAGGEYAGKVSCPGPELTCVAPGYRNGMSASWTIAAHPNRSWPSRPLISGTVSAVEASGAQASSPRITAVLTASAADLQAIPIGARVVLERSDGEQGMWTVAAIESITPPGTIKLRLQQTSLSRSDLLTGVVKLGISDLRRAVITAAPQTVYVSSLNRHALFVVLDRALPSLKSVLVADDTASNPIEMSVVVAGRVTGTTQWAAVLTPSTAFEDIQAGMSLWESASGHITDFGQTSAAAAICGGVGALMLAANPALTAFEVRDILATTTDRIRPGLNQPIATSFHPKLGHGRINAFRAVEAALGYDHPRDLCFEPGGLPSTGHSPESAAVFARVAPYNASSPDPTQPVVFASPTGLNLSHQTIGASGYVCAVITNRLPTTGPGKPSLAAWVRFYVVTAPTGTRFEWPTHWTDNPGTALTDLRSQLIGEVPLNPGIAPGDRRLVQMPWPAWASPSGGDLRPRHLLVEVVPHDGPRIGPTIADNDNLARRLMLFTP